MGLTDRPTGDTTLDAMIINGDTMQMGSVGFLSGVKDAIGVAYEVYRRTEMTLLAGAGATGFAKEMDFQVLPNLGKSASLNCVSNRLFDARNARVAQNIHGLESGRLPAQLLGAGHRDAGPDQELRPVCARQHDCRKE